MPASAMMEPPDRSMPPVMRITVIAQLTYIFVEIWRDTLIRFLEVRNVVVMTDSRMKITARNNIWPRYCFSVAIQ